jgi:cation transport ATPase
VRQKLARWQELWVYWAGGFLAVTGAGWLVCHFGLRAPGPAPHPLEVWWLRAHGAALIAFLTVFGTALPGHVVHGWRYGMNRNSGLSVVVVASLLTLTGYGLYYLVSDDIRSWASVIHWIVGLVSIGAVTVHVILGKRYARHHQQLHHRPEAAAHAHARHTERERV